MEILVIIGLILRFTCSLDHLRAAEVCGDGRKYPKCHESDRSADFLTF